MLKQFSDLLIFDGFQAIRVWPGPSADGLGPRMAPNRTEKKTPRLLLLHLPSQMIIPLVLKLQERHQSDTLIGSIVIDPDCDVPSITMGMLGYLMINVLDTMLNILEDKLVMADFFLQDGLGFGKRCQSIEAVLGSFQTFLNLRNQASVEYDAF